MSFRLPTHRRDAHRKFLMIPSLNKIEILAKGDTSVFLDIKGLMQFGNFHFLKCYLEIFIFFNVIWKFSFSLMLLGNFHFQNPLWTKFFFFFVVFRDIT